ncbi:MAG: hypothetical protein JWP63_2939 [Candidatus Solibacter sp.]|nr:hypothetical protein [Candidatus Solibacter sp.]
MRRMPLDGTADFKRLFDRRPIRGPRLAVLCNARCHLRIFDASSGNIYNSLRSCTKRLGKAALAAACTADDERKHGRGKRASRSACPRSTEVEKRMKSGATGEYPGDPLASALQQSVAQAPSRGRSPDSQVIARSATFPSPKEQWCFLADPLAAHSGATVRDSHPLPFSPAVTGEHLGTVSMVTTMERAGQTAGSNRRLLAIFRLEESGLPPGSFPRL